MPPRHLLLLIILLALTACSEKEGAAPRAPSLGEAFVGPIQMTVRQDIPLHSATVATLKHGDRLELLQARRRFIKVRTSQGTEGWVDGRYLITPQQMTELQQLSEANKNTASMGKAKVFELLNMHSEPSRSSPSFYQLAEGAVVDVIGYRVAPKIVGEAPPTPAALIPPKPIPVRKKKGKGKEKEKDKLTSALPPPPTPRVPDNLRELSYRKPVEEGFRPEDDHRRPNDPPKPPNEDWSLIRSKDGRVGWVLSRMVQMMVPDDVAQYAEGHRITSYFLLQEVQDEELKKGHWLWTTVTKGGQPYQFDSFRVFIWNSRRHRYETAYIERNVIGYHPVSVRHTRRKINKDEEDVPEFSVILAAEQGGCVKKTFAFEINRARLIGREPIGCPAPTGTAPADSKDGGPSPVKPPDENKSFSTRVSEKLSSLKSKLSRQ